MKTFNARILPRLSEACNFCFVFHTDPSLSETFDALPELAGFDLCPSSGGRVFNTARADRFYNNGPSGYLGSGVSYKRSRSGLSQYDAANLLREYSPLVVPSQLHQAILLNLFLRFDIENVTVVTAHTFGELIGEKIPDGFENAFEMQRFFREVVLSYF